MNDLNKLTLLIKHVTKKPVFNNYFENYNFNVLITEENGINASIDLFDKQIILNFTSEVLKLPLEEIKFIVGHELAHVYCKSFSLSFNVNRQIEFECDLIAFKAINCNIDVAKSILNKVNGNYLSNLANKLFCSHPSSVERINNLLNFKK